MDESQDDSSIGFWTLLNIAAICVIGGFAFYVPRYTVRCSYSCQNPCINNLRQMDGAVQQWALENKKKPEDKVSLSDIMPYLKNSVYCPQGGTYKIGPTVSNVPICSVKGHALPP